MSTFGVSIYVWGSIEPPKIGGRVWEKGSIDRAIDQSLWSPAKKKFGGAGGHGQYFFFR